MIACVRVAAPEGAEVKVTKSRESRRVPVSDRVPPMVCRMAAERDAHAPLLVTETGHRLHPSAFKRTLDGPVGTAADQAGLARLNARSRWGPASAGKSE
jgi:hypothetical protein